MATTVVFFDAADTLFRVRGSVGEAYARIAERYGAQLVTAELLPRFRKAFVAMPPMCFPDALPADIPQCEYDWWRTLVRRVFDGIVVTDFDRMFADLFAYFADADAWELFPDTREALGELRRRGVRLGIVSNFDSRLLPVCEGLGISQHFERIVMSGSAGYAKPDPRIFRLALRELGANADEALHIGDSEPNDVQGARAAGIRALRIDRREPSPDPSRQLNSLLELLTAL